MRKVEGQRVQFTIDAVYDGGGFRELHGRICACQGLHANSFFAYIATLTDIDIRL